MSHAIHCIAGMHNSKLARRHIDGITNVNMNNLNALVCIDLTGTNIGLTWPHSNEPDNRCPFDAHVIQ